jgi:6-pyruvoyl-tetrahydropterin synthase
MNHLFVDNLTVIDFAYLNATRGLVGESWIADIVLGGELDEQGMVFDFSHVKRAIKQVIDAQVDHRLVVPKGHPGLLRNDQTPQHFVWPLTNGEQIAHTGPDEAVLWLAGDTVTKAAIATLLEHELKAVLPNNVISVDVHLREEMLEGPYYHYVHGLKKHLGNCQRIAHGHRSPICIHRNEQRETTLEALWAKLWKDIYVGTEEDISRRFVDDNGAEYICFEYEANQGKFALTLPASRVYMMNTDTTVELIAAHIADQLKQEFPEDSIRVKAYEGVGKGALASR